MTLLSELRDTLFAIDHVLQKSDRGDGLPGSLMCIRDVVSPWVETSEAKYMALRDGVSALDNVPKTADGFPVLFGMNLHAVVRVNDDPSVYTVIPSGFVVMNEDGGTVRDGNGNEYEADYERCFVSAQLADCACRSCGRDIYASVHIPGQGKTHDYEPAGATPRFTNVSHPDELNPRAESWLAERRNWEAEVDALRKEVERLSSNSRA